MSAQFVMTTVSFLRKRRTPVTPVIPDEWPRVTVQLPMRNELYTAERAIEAAAALDYPLDRLEIQVLDDSDDTTKDVTERAAARARERGVDVSEIRRADPSGFKAGALDAA